MKKKMTFVCVMLLAASTLNVFSQESKNVIKLNLLSPIVRTINLAFEHAISDGTSLQLRGYYTGFKISSTKYSGFGLTPEARFYFSSSKTAPAGFYVAPAFSYANYSVKEDINKGTMSGLGGSLIIGYQAMFKDRITLEVFAGPEYMSFSTKVSSGSSSAFSTGSINGFGVRAGVTLGIAF